MKLKTAALIAIVCITLHLAINLLWLLLGLILSQAISLVRYFYLFNTLLFDGGIILFLWILYCNQNIFSKGDTIHGDMSNASVTRPMEQGASLKEGECVNAEIYARNNHEKNISYVALAALISGILSIPLSFLSFKSALILIPFALSILLAPVLGVIALIQISLNKNYLRGRLLAILGICLSLFSIICFFSYWITHFGLPA